MALKHPRHHVGLIFASAFITATAAAAKDDPWSATTSNDDPVLHLTASNYESTVFRSGRNGMTMFYQSWCGHCRRFKPTWDQLAQEVHPSIFIGRVDCAASADNEICRSSDITTYPTLKYFLNGVESHYSGSLALEALHGFIDSTLVVQCIPMLDDSTTNCSEKAKQYADKWLGKDVRKIAVEIERLGKVMETSESSTSAELRKWMRERRDILKIIHNAKMVKEKDEL